MKFLNKILHKNTDLSFKIERLEQTIKEIKGLAQEECEKECAFKFCQGKTDDTTCVIYKILEKCK